jgi:hypothetical protein
MPGRAAHAKHARFNAVPSVARRYTADQDKRRFSRRRGGAQLDKIAAQWTGASIFLSALSTVIGSFAK